MIPINQLRVGSYWKLNTQKGIITGGQVLKIVTPCEIADAAEYGIGIELTPEVLEKCGFEKLGYDTYKMKEYTYCEIIDNYGDYHLSAEGAIGSIKIKHLHQLQNLYLSLTGTELTYTL